MWEQSKKVLKYLGRLALPTYWKNFKAIIIKTDGTVSGIDKYITETEKRACIQNCVCDKDHHKWIHKE